MLIKLEFSVSVGFIHKEFVTFHGHTTLKWLEISTNRVIYFGCFTHIWAVIGGLQGRIKLFGAPRQ